MRIYDRYILFLALLFLSTTVFLSAFTEAGLDLYFSIYVIEALVLTELYVYLNPKARRGLNLVSYILFAGFLAIVAQKVVEIL